MVEISFLGHSGVKIRGKKITIVCDPPNPQVLEIPLPKKVTADIVLLTQKEIPAHSNVHLVQPANSKIFEISTPGEYEIQQTEITGIAAASCGSCFFPESTKLTIYQILIDGIYLGFLGTISKLSQDLIEQLGEIDVLFVPVGGKVSIGPKEAVDVITALEPSIVVPVHYNQSKNDNLASLDQFLSQVGKISIETCDKLQITKEKLLPEAKIVTLKPAGVVSG